MISLGVADHATFPDKVPAETYQRDLGCEYCSTMERRKKDTLMFSRPIAVDKEQPRTSGVFGHQGGRLAVPSTGKLDWSTLVYLLCMEFLKALNI